MNIVGLRGQQIKLDIKPSKWPLKSEGACKSKLQYQCGQLLRSKFPFDVILEDFFVPQHNFYWDFFLPQRKIVFEIQGRQHDEFVPFFHNSPKEFDKSKIRDYNKKELCIKNDIYFYDIRSLEEMENLLKNV